MLPSQPPKVLVLAQDSQAGREWGEILRQSGASAWSAPDEVPPGEVIEVIVTDLAAEELERRGFHLTDPHKPGHQRAWLIVGLGSATGADIALPADFAARELLMVCDLAGEIARLRRARDEIARRQHEIMQIAETDPLTGLANRRSWTRELERTWSISRASGQPLWLAWIDLDEFKQVNDRFGYAIGDRVLTRVGRTLAAQLRKDDVIARLGGDEFGVVLAGISEDQAAAVLERLRAAVAALAPLEGISGPTTSIGYAAGGQHADIAEMLAAAEQALRVAKRDGGNRVLRAD